MPDYLFSVTDRFDGGTYYRALINDDQEIERLEEKCRKHQLVPVVTRLDSITAIDRFLDEMENN